MSRDRRGFRFALQPACTRAEWEIDSIQADNAILRQAFNNAEATAASIESAIAAADAHLLANQGTNTLIDVDARRRALVYIGHLQGRLTDARQAVEDARRAWDEGLARLRVARQYAEGFERHRQTALAEHDAMVARQDYQAASDDWLQRLQWKDPA